MSKKTNPLNNLEKNGYTYCSVKNCCAKIEKGKEILLDGKTYCKVCGTLLIKNIFGL